MDKYLKVEHETTLRAIDAALEEFHIELPAGGAVHRDHGVHLLVEQLRRVEAEVERLQAERRWIPVSERLPELTQFADSDHTGFSDSVLILITSDDEPADRYCEVAQYHYSGNPNLRSGWLIGSGVILDTVTHWRPLPDPPGEAAESEAE